VVGAALPADCGAGGPAGAPVGGRAFESVAFWDARYAVDASEFEWYAAPAAAAALAALERVAPAGRGRRPSVLDLGCGTSRLPADAAAAGYLVLAVDVSSIAVHAAAASSREENASRGSRPDFLVADATRLPLRPARFDAVLDKGTADALDCGGDEGAARLLGEAARASRVGGAVVMVSCRDAVRRTADFKAVPTLTLVSVADVGGEPGKPCPDAVVLVATVGPPAALSEGRE